MELFGLYIGLPFSWPEKLAVLSAFITLIFGLMCFFMPRASLKVLRLKTYDDVPEAISEMRGTLAGFYLGVGILVILFQQPLLYLALGAGWGFTAFGRLVSMFKDSPMPKGFSTFNVVSIACEFSLCIFALLPWILG